MPYLCRVQIKWEAYNSDFVTEKIGTFKDTIPKKQTTYLIWFIKNKNICKII